MTKPTVLSLGELLWDMLPTGKRAGGAPVNFIYHASMNGAEGVAISAVGGVAAIAEHGDVARQRRFAIRQLVGVALQLGEKARLVAVQVPVGRVVAGIDGRHQADGAVDGDQQVGAIDAGATDACPVVKRRARPGAGFGDDGGADRHIAVSGTGMNGQPLKEAELLNFAEQVDCVLLQPGAATNRSPTSGTAGSGRNSVALPGT